MTRTTKCTVTELRGGGCEVEGEDEGKYWRGSDVGAAASEGGSEGENQGSGEAVIASECDAPIDIH